MTALLEAVAKNGVLIHRVTQTKGVMTFLDSEITPTNQPDVTPPAALTLRNEPEVSVARYDGLGSRGGSRHAS